MERGLAAHTLAAYRRDLARYQAALSDRGRAHLGDVTVPDVAAYLAGLRQGGDGHPPLAASSAARAMAAVRGLHAFAAAEGLAGADPASQLPPPAPARRLPRAIGIAEVERLLDAAAPAPVARGRGGPLQLRDRALLELLYGTGARISEAVGLDVDDVGAPTLRLAGKGGKHRIVPVGSYAAQALDAYLVRGRPALAAATRRGSASPAVFLNARGGRLTRQGAWGVLQGGGGPGGPGRGVTAHAAPLVRHPPAGRRGRRPGGAGTARPRVGDHHPGLHPGHRGQAPRGLRRGAPTGVLSRGAARPPGRRPATGAPQNYERNGCARSTVSRLAGGRPTP